MRSDSEIINDILINKNVKAYKQLVEKYKNLVFTISYRILKNREEAEEITQDVFLKCYQRLSDLQEKKNFKNWLTRIAYTKSIDKTRLHKMNLTQLEESELQEIEKETPYTLLDKNRSTEYDYKIC